MSKKLSAWAIALNLILILVMIPTFRFNSAQAQESTEGVVEESSTASIEPSGVIEMNWSSEVPEISAEQQAQLEYWVDRVNLPGPALTGGEAEATTATAPAAESATVVGSKASASPKAPLAPGDLQLYRKTLFGGVIPAGFKSNVMESSVAQNGKYAFFNGNWFAARSTNGGVNWSYVNAYNGFPDFCCDQVTIFDESRETFYWLRMGSPNVDGVNKFILGVSNDGGASFCTYTTFPTNVNSTWTGQWWDYPHMQLGADYLYIAWNMFNAAGNWTRTVMLRWPLDALDSCAGFDYNYYENTSWFTFVPVQGSDHAMYFASNWPSTAPQNSRLAIWRWYEDSTSLTVWTKTVAAWSATGKGSAVCGATTGNWAGRTDQRLLSGARYMIHASNLKIPGRNVLAWWWNVKQGGSFPRPYVDAAAFYEDNLAQLGGLQGRPYIFSTTTCFLYPSMAANKRGDLGAVVNYSSGTNLRPAVMFALADDYTTAPPGFNANAAVQISNARPSDNKWGDYNTARAFMPTNDTWVGGAHYIPGATNCTNCSAPVFFNFGRGRDYRSWFYWQNK